MAGVQKLREMCPQAKPKVVRKAPVRRCIVLVHSAQCRLHTGDPVYLLCIPDAALLKGLRAHGRNPGVSCEASHHGRRACPISGWEGDAPHESTDERA